MPRVRSGPVRARHSQWVIARTGTKTGQVGRAKGTNSSAFSGLRPIPPTKWDPMMTTADFALKSPSRFRRIMSAKSLRFAKAAAGCRLVAASWLLLVTSRARMQCDLCLSRRRLLPQRSLRNQRKSHRCCRLPFRLSLPAMRQGHRRRSRRSCRQTPRRIPLLFPLQDRLVPHNCQLLPRLTYPECQRRSRL